jgi:hypothetical protein
MAFVICISIIQSQCGVSCLKRITCAKHRLTSAPNETSEIKQFWIQLISFVVEIILFGNTRFFVKNSAIHMKIRIASR